MWAIFKKIIPSCCSPYKNLSGVVEFCAFYQNVLDWVWFPHGHFWGGSSLRMKEWVNRVCPMRSRVRVVRHYMFCRFTKSISDKDWRRERKPKESLLSTGFNDYADDGVKQHLLSSIKHYLGHRSSQVFLSNANNLQENYRMIETIIRDFFFLLPNNGEKRFRIKMAQRIRLIKIFLKNLCSSKKRIYQKRNLLSFICLFKTNVIVSIIKNV